MLKHQGLKRKAEESTEEERCTKKFTASIGNLSRDCHPASINGTQCLTVDPNELYKVSSDGEEPDEPEVGEHFWSRSTATELISNLKLSRAISTHSDQASLIESWIPPTPPSSQETISSSQESASNEGASVTRTLPVTTRKRIFLYDTPPETVARMLQWTNRLLSKHLGSKDPQKCWLHPDPTQSMCNVSGIHGTLTFRHAGERQKLKIQFGFAALLLSGKVTEQQRRGLIEERWHLSHLCGNWTCLNSAHFTIESGRINLSRNHCFPRTDIPCIHQPGCLRLLKRPHTSLIPSKPPTGEVSALETVDPGQAE